MVCILKPFSYSHFGPSTLFFATSDRGSIYTGAIAAIRPYRCHRGLCRIQGAATVEGCRLIRGRCIWETYKLQKGPCTLPSHNHSHISLSVLPVGKRRGRRAQRSLAVIIGCRMRDKGGGGQHETAMSLLG